MISKKEELEFGPDRTPKPKGPCIFNPSVPADPQMGRRPHTILQLRNDTDNTPLEQAIESLLLWVSDETVTRNVMNTLLRLEREKRHE